MKSNLETCILPEGDYPAWNELVRQSPEGSIYSTPEYLDTLCRIVGGRFRILSLKRGNELAGGVALYEVPSRFGPMVSPRLLLQYNGIVLRRSASSYPSVQTAEHLEQTVALREALDAAGHARITLKCRHPFIDARPFIQAGWTVKPSYTYEVAVADLDTAWNRVEHNLRRLIQRCQRQGIAFDESQDFDSYFRMHLQTHQRKGAALYLPENLFRKYFTRLYDQGLCHLFTARLPEGRAIAAQLVLTGGHPVTHTVSAAADAEWRNLGASAFLRWKVFEWLSQHEHVANDLTDASLNPVTHFKAQLGGELRTCLALHRRERWPVRAAGMVARIRSQAGRRRKKRQGDEGLQS